MRVYFGLTSNDLERVIADGVLEPRQGHAVTPTLREWYATGDLEELEYAAMEDAARDSLVRLSDDPSARSRRVVLAVEVPDQGVRQDPATGRSVVQVADALSFDRVEAAHIDDADAEDTISAAAAAVPKALTGDDDAAFTVDEALGHELLWYARQELAHLEWDG